MRELLEVEAAGEAARYITDAEIEHLRKLMTFLVPLERERPDLFDPD